MKKVVMTGGGTAGHVYPTLAVKENLGTDYEVHYIGGNGMEKDIILKENIPYHEISPVKLQRKLTLKNLLIPFKLFKSISQSKKILEEIKPSIIFSKGGFVAVPVVIAAHKLKIPVVSHESDLSLGLANKIILHYCTAMCVSFKETEKSNSKCIYTGQPIRKKVLNGNKRNVIFQDCDRNKQNLLVLGGSSGAKFINEKVWANLDNLTQKYNVLHVTGKQVNEERMHCFYKQIPYAENIGDYLAWADLVLSRAGSGAINEYLTLNKPMLLIPLSKKCSRGDQIENAKLFTSLGLADMLEEEDYSDEKLLEKLDNLIKNDKKYISNMKKIAKVNPCDEIIKLLKRFELRN